MIRLSVLAGIALLILATAVRAQQAQTPMPPNFAVVPVEQDANWAVEWWLPRHRQKLAEAEQADVELLMLGDSITQGWESAGAEVWQRYYGERRAFNLGFSGDRTEHVLWRLQDGAVDGMQPKLVVLMIGTNNTGHRMDPADYTAEGIGMIVDELQMRLPESKILLLAVFPRSTSPYNDMRKRNQAINARIRERHDGERVFYLDVNEAFLENDGTLRSDLMPDLLHPNAAGYAAWAEAMEAEVAALLSGN